MGVGDVQFRHLPGPVLQDWVCAISWEVDCRDVTLRLTCKQVMAFRDHGGRERVMTAGRL